MKASFNNIIANLVVYGIVHAVVDGIALAVVLTLLVAGGYSQTMFVSILLLYFVLGFASRPLTGAITDYLRMPKEAAILGGVFVLLAVLVLTVSPLGALIFAGLGNSFFHVGGGSISLNVMPEKAFPPGFFIAPGASGIFLGAAVATTGNFIARPAILLLVISLISMLAVKAPTINYDTTKVSITSDKIFTITLLLLLLSIAIYSFISLIIAFPWKSNYALAVVLIIIVVIGKVSGGVLADKFGWIQAGVGGMFLSIFLLSFGASAPSLAIPGMFLINFSVPISTAAIANLLPGRSAFAFGLSSLALILGATPAFLGMQSLLNHPAILFVAIGLGTCTFYLGLQYIIKK